MKKTYNITKKLGRRNLSLSIVALVLVFVMAIGVSYSWIENITAIEITNQSDSDNSTSKATQGIKEDIDSTILIGNVGGDGKQSTYSQIDLGKYFNGSGDMHLTSCSGNGESFYFKTLKGSQGVDKYRIGTEDDENVNYISATFKVQATDEADVDFWFYNKDDGTKTSVKIGDEEVDNAYFSITVDGETNVYSSNSTGTYKCINNVKGDTKNQDRRSIAAYTFGDATNTDGTKANENVLFSVPAGQTKEVTVRIWLQDISDTNTYTTDKSYDINLVLASTWAVTRRITFFNGTTDIGKGTGDKGWLSNNAAGMYVAIADKDNNKLASTTNYWELKFDSSTNTAYADIPSYYYSGDKLYIFRCNGSYNNTSGDGLVTHAGISCWNYWDTEIPVGFDDETFNILGNTPIVNVSNHDNQSDVGYVTWGDVEKITVVSNVNLNQSTSKVMMLVHDFDTGYYYPLYGAVNSNKWEGYIPTTSDKIEFIYNKDGFDDSVNAKNSINVNTSDKNCYKNASYTYRWGYSKSDTNPQTRPYGDTDYNIYSSTTGSWTDQEKSGYVLKIDGSSDVTFYKSAVNGTTAIANVTLTKDSLYKMKIANSSGTLYSNTGVMSRADSTNWPMTTGASGSYMGFITGETDGDYIFTLDTSTMKLSVTYPGSGGASRIYLVTSKDGWTKNAYMWKTENNSTTDNGTFPGQSMNYFDTLNGKYVYWLSYKDGVFPNKVIFSTYDGNGNKLEQSGDLTFSSSYTVYYW